jgi:hypothetical protein
MLFTVFTGKSRFGWGTVTLPGLRRVFEVLVAAGLPNLVPPVSREQSDDVPARFGHLSAHLHVTQ